jgi:hypothetical protein
VAAVAMLALASCNEPGLPLNPVREIVAGGSGDKGAIELVVDGTRQVEVAVLPADADDADKYGKYTYKSSNEAVFTVSESGLVTAKGAGEAMLTVIPTNNDNLRGTCLVTVSAKTLPVTSIVFDEAFREYYAEAGVTVDVKATVLPADATDPRFVYSSSDEKVATVSEHGRVRTIALGDAVIYATAVDGSGVRGEMKVHVRNYRYEPLDRTGWNVTTSHPYAWDKAVIGEPGCLVDGKENTCLVLVKFGKSIDIGLDRGTLTVGKDEEVSFVVDMLTPREFGYFQWSHRVSNPNANLRATKISVYGSNDPGETKAFDLLLENAPVANDVNHVWFRLDKKYSYRYFKVRITGVNSGGNTVQISELNIGSVGYEPLPARRR